MTPEEHQHCPGHVAHVAVMIYEPDPDDIDQDEVGRDAAGDDVTEVRITYGCTDPEQYRHLGRYGDLTRPPNSILGPVPVVRTSRTGLNGKPGRHRRNATPAAS